MMHPIQRGTLGKPAAPGADPFGAASQSDAAGASPSFIGVFGLPFAQDASVSPSFIFPPLPFADDGAE